MKLTTLALSVSAITAIAGPGNGILTIVPAADPIDGLRGEVSILRGFVPDTSENFPSAVGSLPIILDVDTSADLVRSIEFAASSIALDDMTFQIDNSPDPSNDFISTGLTGTASTKGRAIDTNPDSTFPATRFNWTIDSGSISSNSDGVDEPEELADEALNIRGSGSGLANATVISRSANATLYNIEIRLPVFGNRFLRPIDGSKPAFSIDGALNFQGEILAYNSIFTEWAVVNGLTDIDTAVDPQGDANGDSLSNAVSFALGLLPDDDASAFALNVLPDDTLEMTLPASGTLLPISITASETLDAGPWTDVLATFPAGSSGAQTLDVSSDATERFYRLEVVIP